MSKEQLQKQRTRKVYGRRIGRTLRGERMEALEKGLPKYELKLEEVESLTANHDQIWLEIGFGNGEHIIWQAEHNPDKLMIGCEPFINGVSYCVRELEEKEIGNVKIWPDDGRAVLEALPDNSLERIFVLHPDPWHKTRHHKRRFIQKETLDHFARLLKPEGLLRMASDHVGMAEWMLEKANEHTAFTWLAETCDDWRKPKADWPQTRYEAKGIEAGRKPYYLEFRNTKN